MTKCEFCDNEATVEVQMRTIVRVHGLTIPSAWEHNSMQVCRDCSPKLRIEKDRYAVTPKPIDPDDHRKPVRAGREACRIIVNKARRERRN